jgi:PAS domain S-box-containing protein
MKHKSKADLLQEIERLQRRIAELEPKGGAPDITERKRAEGALASSEQFLNNVIEQSPQSLWISDSDGTLIKMNPACRELFGATDEEVVGKYNILKDNVIEEQGFMPLVENVFEKGEVARFTLDYDLLRVEQVEVKKSTHTILDVVVSPLKDMHGKLTNALVQHKDITERKRAEKELLAANQQLAASNQQLRATEQQLRASNQQLESGVERLADAQAIARLGSWEFDAAKDVITGSDEFYRLFGVGHDQLRTYQAFLDLLHPDDREHVGRDVQESLIKKALYDTEYRVRMPDGDYRDIHARGQIFADDAGKTVRMVGTCLDVTERKRMEEALRESEHKFRDTVRFLDEGYYSCTLEGRVLEHNMAFNQILGFDLAQNLSGEQLPDFWQNPDERKEYLNELMTRGSIRNYLINAKKKSGEKIVVMANSHLVKDKKDRLVRIDGTFTDFTERKRAEEALRETKDNLERRVLERTGELTRSKRLLDETGRLARVGGWELDLKNNVLSFSDVVKEIHEVDPEYQPTLEAAIKFYAPEVVPVISEAVRRAIEYGESYDVELQLITAKQNRIWVRTIGQAYRENGEIMRIGGVFQDITARKLAEIETRKKSEQLQLLSTELEIIIDSIPGLVFYKDKNNRFIRVNKYMSDVYNMSKKQLEGMNLNELHSKEQAQAYYEDDLQVMRSRQSKLNIDEPWETETGIRWVSTSKIPYIDETGEVVGVIGVSMDVTERKLAEDELKKHREHLEELVKERTEKLAVAIRDLERSNKELEQFAYVASHDLQEPLRMVSSYTQLLAQRYEGQLDDKAKKYIDYAVDGAVRMQRLINDLLMYSRVGTRGKPPEPTDVHSVLGEVIRNLGAAIDESRAIVTNDDLPTVLVDASQFAQVFQNLIANAIKFRGESPPRIHVSAHDQGCEWAFSISDKGIGIDPKYKDKLFVIFQRLHTKQEYPGTGIGLALCKRIVERHGGRIWFESEPGKGSTFFFSIPN